MLNELARYYMCVHKNKFYYTNCGINRSCALCVSVHTFSDIFFGGRLVLLSIYRVILTKPSE